MVKECETFISFIKSGNESKGMKLELDEAKKLNKNKILLIKDGINAPEFEKSANKIIRYSNFEDLYLKLRDVKI